MTILLPTVAFAGLCVWLAVRIVNRRKRLATWTVAAILFGMPMHYLLSFGPTCWWLSEPQTTQMGKSVFRKVWHAPPGYWPIGWAASRAPTPITVAIRWYATVGIGN